jgi:hypothetical protein
MNTKLDCGWLTGDEGTWDFSPEVDQALKTLPPLSRREREEKLTAQIKLFDKVSGWEWYLCEFNPETKLAKGLVKGFAIESGPICMSTLGKALQARIVLVFDFKPQSLVQIRKDINQSMTKSTLHTQPPKFRYDAFISYASEDETFASEIAGALRGQGISVWYAPVTLKIGDPLRRSLEDGMRQSFAGILLVSPQYIAKQWTEYEFDTLIRQYIEEKKKILPIWHNIAKAQVDSFSTGLTGIVALKSDLDFKHIIDNIVYSLSGAAPTQAGIPSYESPIFRFFQGRGELIDSAGRAFNVWEAALHLREDQYPIWVAGRLISRDEILYKIFEQFIQDSGLIRVNEEDKKRLYNLCKAAGFDIDKMK